MRGKFTLLNAMAIVEVLLGIALLLLSTLLTSTLSDFIKGVCMGIAGTLILGGVILGVWNTVCKNKSCNI